MTDTLARLTELEIALTHQERLAEELSELVREQAARIDRLERRIAELADRLAAAEAAEAQTPGVPARERPPPHW